MTTLTSENVTISVAVLFGISPLVWILFYLLNNFRPVSKTEGAMSFLESPYCRDAYFVTVALYLAAAILMIIYSLDGGVPANSAQ